MLVNYIYMQNPNYLLDDGDIANAMNSLGVQDDRYIISSIMGNNADSLEQVLIDRLSQPNPSRFLNIAYNAGASAPNASQPSGFAKAGHWVAIRLDIQNGQCHIADSLPNQARLQAIQQDMHRLGFKKQAVFPSYDQKDVVSCGAYTVLNLLDMQNDFNAPSRSEADNRQYATQIMNYYSNAQGASNQPFPQQSTLQSTQLSSTLQSQGSNATQPISKHAQGKLQSTQLSSTLQPQGSNPLIQPVRQMRTIRNNMITGQSGNVQVNALSNNNMIGAGNDNAQFNLSSSNGVVAGGNDSVQASVFSTENRIFGNHNLQINLIANRNTIVGEDNIQINCCSSDNRAVGHDNTQINLCRIF